MNICSVISDSLSTLSATLLSPCVYQPVCADRAHRFFQCWWPVSQSLYLSHTGSSQTHQTQSAYLRKTGENDIFILVLTLYHFFTLGKRCLYQLDIFIALYYTVWRTTNCLWCCNISFSEFSLKIILQPHIILQPSNQGLTLVPGLWYRHCMRKQGTAIFLLFF